MTPENEKIIFLGFPDEFPYSTLGNMAKEAPMSGSPMDVRIPTHTTAITKMPQLSPKPHDIRHTNIVTTPSAMKRSSLRVIQGTDGRKVTLV